MNTLWAIYLSEQRHKKKYKRNQLAELCGVDPSYITLIERDGYVPKNEIIVSLSKALECDVDKSLIIAGYAPKTVSVSECMHILNMNGENVIYDSIDHQLISVLRSINNLPDAKRKNAIKMINSLIENSIKKIQTENNKVSNQNIDTNNNKAQSDMKSIPLSEASNTNTSSQTDVKALSNNDCKSFTPRSKRDPFMIMIPPLVKDEIKSDLTSEHSQQTIRTTKCFDTKQNESLIVSSAKNTEKSLAKLYKKVYDECANSKNNYFKIDDNYINPKEKKLIDDNPLLFYKCTSNRIVPTEFIIKFTNSYFQDKQYSEIAIEELYQHLRLKLNFSSVNRANLRALFESDETLDYEHFQSITSKVDKKYEETGIDELLFSDNKPLLSSLKNISLKIKTLLSQEEFDSNVIDNIQQSHLNYISEVKDVFGRDSCIELVEETSKAVYCLSAAQTIISSLKEYTEWKYSLLSLRQNQNLLKLKVLPLLYAYTNNDSIISAITAIFKNNNIKYVEHLINLNVFDLEDDTKIFLSNFVKWIAVDQILSFNTEWIDLFKRSRDTFIIKKRAEGLTLDTIGKELNITRERVRQLESKFFYLFDKLIIKHNIPYLILSQTESDYLITIDDINSFVVNHSDVLTYCLKNNSYKDIKWAQEINRFIVGECEWFDNLIKYINKNIADLVPKESFNQNIEQLYDYCNHKIDRNLINTILNNHYTLQGEVYTKHKISKSQMYKEVLKYYPDGICIYDKKTVDTFRKLVKDAFGDIDLSDNDRAIQARIADIAVLCGRGKYILPEYIYIDEGLLHKIYLYIVNNKRSSIMFMEIYNKFKTSLKAAKIDNHYFLQGILKYKYNNSFTFAKDYLIKNNKTETNIKDEIEDFIRIQKSIVDKKTIKNQFSGITDSVILNATANNPHILQWGFGQYIHIEELHLSPQDRTRFKNYLDHYISSGAVSAARIFEEVYPKENQFFAKNQIENHHAFFSLLQHFFGGEYEFSSPYIAPLGAKNLTFMGLVREYISDYDRLSLSELKEYVDQLRSGNIVFSALLEEISDSFIRAGEDLLIRKDALPITPEVMEEIHQLLLTEMEGRGFIAAAKLDNFLFYPPVGISWNPYLLVSLIKYFSNKMIILSISKDYRYLNEIIIESSLNIIDQDELIKYALEQESRRASFKNMQEVTDFLTEEKLIVKKIPSSVIEKDYVTKSPWGGADIS